MKALNKYLLLKEDNGANTKCLWEWPPRHTSRSQGGIPRGRGSPFVIAAKRVCRPHIQGCRACQRGPPRGITCSPRVRAMPSQCHQTYPCVFVFLLSDHATCGRKWFVRKISLLLTLPWERHCSVPDRLGVSKLTSELNRLLN